MERLGELLWHSMHSNGCLLARACSFLPQIQSIWLLGWEGACRILLLVTLSCNFETSLVFLLKNQPTTQNQTKTTNQPTKDHNPPPKKPTKNPQKTSPQNPTVFFSFSEKQVMISSYHNLWIYFQGGRVSKAVILHSSFNILIVVAQKN